MIAGHRSARGAHRATSSYAASYADGVSLIRLRTHVQRRRRQVAVVAILAALSTLIAAHHGRIAAASHADHGTPVPVTELGTTVAAVCLAVIPLVALLAAGLAAWRLARSSLRLPALPALPQPAVSTAAGRRARDGPYLLCVMRC